MNVQLLYAGILILSAAILAIVATRDTTNDQLYCLALAVLMCVLNYLIYLIV